MTGESPLHPSHDQLVAFGLGELEDDAHQRVEQHVEDCGHCCKVLLDLPGDTMVSLLRATEVENSVGAHHPARAPKESGTVEHLSGAVRISSDDVPLDLRDHPRYRVVELLGRGGMGDVYKAEHRLMHRPLALKVINRDLVKNPTAIDRFHREAQASARLDHPNIVTAYDAERAGESHLLAMEFVEGTDLAEVVRQRGPLPIDEACRYIQQAAEGLQHAYKAGMIHRDIKPQNLMLTADEKIKILDFGLAGLVVDAILVDEDLSGVDNSGDSSPRSLTAVGSMMGTPDYVAPEQARDARSADIRADIYALGCTLYFLLTGQPPFPNGSAMDKVRAHQRQEPIPVTRLRPDVPLDLELVLMKMMAKKLTQRYRRPAEVADILQHFVDGSLPFNDSSPFFSFVRSRTWRLTKIAVLLTLGAVIWIVSDRGRVEVESDVDDVKVVVSQDGREVKIIDLKTDSSVRWLSAGGYEVRLKSDRNDVKLSHNKLTIKRWGKQIVRVTRVQPRGRQVATDSQSASDVTLIDKPLRKLTGHTAIVRGLDVSPDGRRLISASWDGSARLWDLETGEMLHLFHHEPRVNDAKFSLGGRKVILAHNNSVLVYDAETYERLPLEFEHPQAISKLEFSRDGRRLLTGCQDGQTRVWNTQSSELLKTLSGHQGSVTSVLFTAGNQQVLSGSYDKTVRRFNANTGTLLAWYPHPGLVNTMCSSPEGGVVYVGGSNGKVFAWEFQTGQVLKRFRGHEGEILRLATHGRMLVSASSDRTALIWDVATGHEVARLVDHQDRIDSVAISPDGRLIVTGGGFLPRSKSTWERPDYAIRVWEVTPDMSPSSPADKSTAARVESRDEPPPNRQPLAEQPPLVEQATNSLGIIMLLVPDGEFWMGATDEEIEPGLAAAQGQFGRDLRMSEGPRHRVQLTEPFWLAATEVTVAQFRKFADDTEFKTDFERMSAENADRPAGFRGTWREPGFAQTDECPVVLVSWNDCVQFCNWLSEQEGFAPAYAKDDSGGWSFVGGDGYRLPFEAEWEYACRAGTTTLNFFGDDPRSRGDCAWSADNSDGRTHPVGKKQPNPFGLFDIQGNAGEWVNDWYDKDYYSQSPLRNPRGPVTGVARVRRGWAWGHNLRTHFRSAFRHPFNPSQTSWDTGFRQARNGEIQQAAEDAEMSPHPRQQSSSRLLTSDASKSWVDIFDGRSLHGWQRDGAATWTVEDGVLVGRGPPGHGRLLYTRESFEDFEVRAECKVTAEGNSGIYIRTGLGGQFDNGYEAQITTLADQVTWTGGIWPHTRFKRRVVEDNAWFVLEARAIDNVISVKVNGVQTAQYTDDQRQFRKGLIGLQAWGEPTEVAFRRIQVRKLHIEQNR